MATALTVTNFDKGLKVLYTPQRVKLLALLPKYESFGGKNMPIFLWHRAGQGVSATFATAQANADVGGYVNFDLTRVKKYGVGKMENEVMEASMGDKAAFLQATSEIDGLMHQVTRDIAINLYRSKTNVKGTVAAGTVTGGGTAYDTTTNLLTLANREDVTNFEVGMKLVFAAPGSPTTLKNSGTAVEITAIDRSNGKLELSDDPTGGTSIAGGDIIAREGDLTSGSAALGISGLEEWIPTTVASSGDSHFGVDRYEDRDRLAGIYVDGSSMTIEDALIEGAARAAEAGASPDKIFVSPMKFARLTRELGSKVVHDIVKSPDMAKIGFKTIKFMGPSGEMDVVADPNCQYDTAWMLSMDTWKFCTLNGAPRILDYKDGAGRWLRVTDADQVEYRIGMYGNLGCHFPGHNVRIKLAS